MEASSLKLGELSAPPRHVAIIMDGNGRWARARGLPRVSGHKQGAESLRETVKSAIQLNISYLTLYGFSSENWRRPAQEVSDLMGLLTFYLKREIKELDQQGVCFKVIGDRNRLASSIIKLIEQAENKTKNNTRLTLTIALSYGARDEIVMAARTLAKQVENGSLSASDITNEIFSNALYTYDVPDPDLLIRTSGEMRLSNFLLWQLAYAEFVFVDTLWPDFSHSDLKKAVDDFHGRDRRYGTTA